MLLLFPGFLIINPLVQFFKTGTIYSKTMPPSDSIESGEPCFTCDVSYFIRTIGFRKGTKRCTCKLRERKDFPICRLSIDENSLLISGYVLSVDFGRRKRGS